MVVGWLIALQPSLGILEAILVVGTEQPEFWGQAVWIDLIKMGLACRIKMLSMHRVLLPAFERERPHFQAGGMRILSFALHASMSAATRIHQDHVKARKVMIAHLV